MIFYSYHSEGYVSDQDYDFFYDMTPDCPKEWLEKQFNTLEEFELWLNTPWYSKKANENE